MIFQGQQRKKLPFVEEWQLYKTNTNLEFVSSIIPEDEVKRQTNNIKVCSSQSREWTDCGAGGLLISNGEEVWRRKRNALALKSSTGAKETTGGIKNSANAL